MSGAVKRVYVEKKPGFQVEEERLLRDLRDNLKQTGLTGLRLLNCYDVQGLSDADFDQAVRTVFSEPNVDSVYLEQLALGSDSTVIAWAYLPGQFDQRADSAAQCIQLFTQKAMPLVRSSRVLVLEGACDIAKVKHYLINPVDSGEVRFEKPASLELDTPTPPDVPVLEGFNGYSEAQVLKLREDMGLAMSGRDLLFCQEYFQSEDRNPTMTEIRVIDTYWSDHCRHTTFMTRLQNVEFEGSPATEPIKAAWDQYRASRHAVYGETDRPVSLMDMATIAMKELRKTGHLDDLEISEEINACSIEVPVDVDGVIEPWLVMFKNETHNHPTEIEPFGGAATCLGGAIRDPLSGRSYVYQAMRVTGSGDPREAIEDTLPGKLPQRIITTGAAHGYSSYGNQIGLATGEVREYYHPGFVAKRMEIGAVIGAAPRTHVVRLEPATGDVIVLVGGQTGRDGCGGATGSSVEHDEHSLASCGAQVQKGNAPTERKLQRLYRNEEASRMIKRSNDFGAGGVSVAIGELADSIDINLDAVPLKYDGLDGTEIAISESQERMAVVLDPKDVQRFMELAEAENLETAAVATVTDSGRLRMLWRGQEVLNLSRTFLNTSGVPQNADARIAAPNLEQTPFQRMPEGGTVTEKWLAGLVDLNVASNQGMAERFDSTIGCNTVVMPFGGKYQKTPVSGMVARIPVQNGETHTATVMTHGYDPELAQWSPFHGALYALLLAAARTAALGADIGRMRYTLQEYFEKLGTSPEKWGKPVGALLGALTVQQALKAAAIGGKDSMSGTFKDMDVPPTLVAFAVTPVDDREVITPELKNPGNDLLWLTVPRDVNAMPDFERFIRNCDMVRSWQSQGCVKSAGAVDMGGLAAHLSKRAFGNHIGFRLEDSLTEAQLFEPAYGSLLIEWNGAVPAEVLQTCGGIIAGRTLEQADILYKEMELPLGNAQAVWENVLTDIFPETGPNIKGIRPCDFTGGMPAVSHRGIARPKVVIPAFPGTNCEEDTARAFREAGAEVDLQIFRNRTPEAIEESIRRLEAGIRSAQMIAIPGGFSAGDEPDGSGKFIAAVFRNPRVKEATMELLKNRDGLMLGICNGFQALIKLGLISHGEIRDLEPQMPTLTLNGIGRHISTLARVRVASDKSPWMREAEVGSTWLVPLSHGEGRFVASDAVLESMIENGQIATQYVDDKGIPSTSGRWNVNSSMLAVEGLFSPDGRVFGKMGHAERHQPGLYKNVPGPIDMGVFRSGVAYFE